jgi:hypothetical protein
MLRDTDYVLNRRLCVRGGVCSRLRGRGCLSRNVVLDGVKTIFGVSNPPAEFGVIFSALRLLVIKTILKFVDSFCLLLHNLDKSR